MSVLYIGLPENSTAWLQRIYADFVSILGREPLHRVYDHKRPPAGQFAGIEVVVEAGGSFASAEMIDEAAAHGVRFWQVIGTGIDHVDVARFHRHELPLSNVPGVFSSIALAEHALFCMLFFAKNYRQSQHSLQSRVLCDPVNEELCGKTLSVIGLGASGRELARRAAPFGLRILAIDVVPPDPAALAGVRVDFIGGPKDFDHVVAEADYLSLHVPLTDSTRHMVDRRKLGLMKPTAVLLNLARSAIVEEAALIDALRQGTIRGAALDVFPDEPVRPDHPLLRLDNVLATPHTGGVTTGTSQRRVKAAVENILRVLGGQSPRYLVEDVAADRGNGDRVRRIRSEKHSADVPQTQYRAAVDDESAGKP